MNLLTTAKKELLRSNADRRHPFRWFILGTRGEDGQPALRTVIKRDMDADWNILVYTDRRSSKVGQIQAEAGITALFYHPKKQLQIRCRGRAEIVAREDQLYAEHLHRVKSSGRLQDYSSTQAPGSPLPKGKVEYGDELHFCLLRLRAENLDILQLDRRQHQRARYVLEAKEWKEYLLVP